MNTPLGRVRSDTVTLRSVRRVGVRAALPMLWCVVALTLSGCIGLGGQALFSAPGPTIDGTIALTTTPASQNAPSATLADATVQAFAYTTGSLIASAAAKSDAHGRFSLVIPAASTHAPVVLVVAAADAAGRPLRLSVLLSPSDLGHGVAIDPQTTVVAEAWGRYVGQGFRPDPADVAKTIAAAQAWFTDHSQAVDLHPGGALLAGAFGQGLNPNSPVAAALAATIPPPPDSPLAKAHQLISDLGASGLGTQGLAGWIHPPGLSTTGLELLAQFTARVRLLSDFVLSGQIDTVAPGGEYEELGDGFLEPSARISAGQWRIDLHDAPLSLMYTLLNPAQATATTTTQPVGLLAAVRSGTDSSLKYDATLTFNPIANGAHSAPSLDEVGELQGAGLSAPLDFKLHVDATGFSPRIVTNLTATHGTLIQGNLSIADGTWTATMSPMPGVTAHQASPSVLYFNGSVVTSGMPPVAFDINASQSYNVASIDGTATRLGRTLTVDISQTGDAIRLHAAETVRDVPVTLDVTVGANNATGQITVGGTSVATLVDTDGHAVVQYADGAHEPLP